VDRPGGHRAEHGERGDELHVLELEGFLFFGTAHSLFERIRARVHDPDLPPLRFLVLDFRRVTGLDSSTVLSFTKACALAHAEGFVLVLTALDGRAQRLLAQAGLTEEAHPELRCSDDLDHGVQWCEEQVLAEVSQGAGDAPATVVESLDGERAEALYAHLERLDIPAGHVLIRQGDMTCDVYYLEEGRLTVQIARDSGTPVRLREVGAGTVIGELTMYLGVPRTATVVSAVPCRLYRLSPEALEAMEQTDPVLATAVHRWLARVLAQRLADSVRTIEALLD
jgi:sulfate permease, SulP family